MRTGRRPGDSGAREAILEAARANFAARGYDGATIRNIARDAGVDPALVHHYFGSKERIFAAAVEFPFDPSKVLPSVVEPGIEGLGERLVRLFVTVWDEAPTRSPLLTLMRSAVTHDPAATLLREFIEREVLAGALDAELTGCRSQRTKNCTAEELRAKELRAKELQGAEVAGRGGKDGEG